MKQIACEACCASANLFLSPTTFNLVLTHSSVATDIHADRCAALLALVRPQRAVGGIRRADATGGKLKQYNCSQIGSACCCWHGNIARSTVTIGSLDSYQATVFVLNGVHPSISPKK